MKNMFKVTTVLPHNLLQTNPCIRQNFSTQVFRKSAAQLHYVGPELLVPNEEHVQCDHRFASQSLANEPLHSLQLFDTNLQKARGTTSLCGPWAALHFLASLASKAARAFWRLVSKSCDECKGSFARGCEAKRWSHWTCSSLGTIFQPIRTSLWGLILYQMSNAFVIIKMCYVYSQWYDISCATLYV